MKWKVEVSLMSNQELHPSSRHISKWLFEVIILGLDVFPIKSGRWIESFWGSCSFSICISACMHAQSLSHVWLCNPNGLQSTRLLSPWDFLGKNTGMGCHFLLQGSSQPRDWTCVSCIAGRFFHCWATWEVSVFLRFYLIFSGYKVIELWRMSSYLPMSLKFYSRTKCKRNLFYGKIYSNLMEVTANEVENISLNAKVRLK